VDLLDLLDLVLY
jgi:hypothetical protein